VLVVKVRMCIGVFVLIHDNRALWVGTYPGFRNRGRVYDAYRPLVLLHKNEKEQLTHHDHSAHTVLFLQDTCQTG